MSIVFYASRESTCGVCFTPYTPNYLRSHSNIIFVFGDNLLRKGKEAQAIIRDLPNAVGLTSKRTPDHCPNAYMTGTDSDYADVTSDLALIEGLASAGKQLVFPSTGIGTGLARLATTAPDLLSYIDSEISKLIHADYRLLRQYNR
jgi:hypothetical protein